MEIAGKKLSCATLLSFTAPVDDERVPIERDGGLGVAKLKEATGALIPKSIIRADAGLRFVNPKLAVPRDTGVEAKLFIGSWML